MNEYASYRNKSADDLYIQIALSEYVQSEAFIKDTKRLIALGKSLVNKHKKTICSALNKGDVKSKLTQEKNIDKLFFILSDTISAIGIGIPVASIAALIVLLGIDSFCCKD